VQIRHQVLSFHKCDFILLINFVLETLTLHIFCEIAWTPHLELLRLILYLLFNTLDIVILEYHIFLYLQMLFPFSEDISLIGCVRLVIESVVLVAKHSLRIVNSSRLILLFLVGIESHLRRSQELVDFIFPENMFSIQLIVLDLERVFDHLLYLTIITFYMNSVIFFWCCWTIFWSLTTIVYSKYLFWACTLLSFCSCSFLFSLSVLASSRKCYSWTFYVILFTICYWFVCSQPIYIV